MILSNKLNELKGDFEKQDTDYIKIKA